MGKGDPKTRRGKTYRGNYGNTRPHAATVVAGSKTVAVAAKKPATVAKKAAAPAVRRAAVKKA
ncbi:30S ribosomal protein THX [Metallibacterium sp.]|uniref:30S ribosomal protein THX n=1 Tax=Metallibacterium sp. TaxID=2940281 RepID=UPI002628D426|nr:30S ribosomal protein THX [Metallibacterium sp.]